MNPNPPPHATVTRKKVIEIARELAVINGHSSQHVSQYHLDREQMLQAQQNRRLVALDDPILF